MAVLGDLVVNLSADSSKFTSGLDRAKGSVTSFSSLMSGAMGGVAMSITNAFIDAGKFAVRSLVGIGQQIISLAADAEVMRMEFSTLLGDVGKGAAMFKDLEKFALRTSFDLQSASDAARGMLATGVKESELVGTMQLIGDLAMGDANKLRLVSKAYTDVLSKGKLQAQELRQFAENGINIRQALMDMLGKTSAEITKMSEDGVISFQMMQNALISMTDEGGRFFNAMANRNETFTGQWDALVETIQGFGRDLGEMVLPMLKDLVSEARAFAESFRAMEDKPKFIADLLDAALNVAFESIKENWGQVLIDMQTAAWDAGKAIAHNLDPSKHIADAVMGVIGNPAAKMQGNNAAPSNLDLAKKQFADLLATMPKPDNAAVGFDKLVAQPDVVAGSKLGDLAGGMADSAKSLFEKASGIAQNKLTDLKIKGGFLGSIVENMFGVGAATGPGKEKALAAEKAKTQDEPAFAAAMQKGSAEAFSTIVQAMFGNTDPNVKATKEQTSQLIKFWKANKKLELTLKEAFA